MPILFVAVLFFAACAAPATPVPAPTRAPGAQSTRSPIPRATVTQTRVIPTQTVQAAMTATVPITAAPTNIPTQMVQGAMTAPVPITAAPAPQNNVVTSETTVAFDAYPYEHFLSDRVDAETNVAFTALDRAAYDAGVNTFGKQAKTFRAIILENEFLKLTFLPGLGGRLYQITFKPTGQNLLYNNAVLKPTPWGMPEQGGWLAAGGIEWAFPTQEHGFEWNTPWDAQIVREANGTSIVLTDSRAGDRARAQVRVTLPAHAAYIAISPRIENPTTRPMRMQFWTNAMLTLGATGAIPPQTEFVFPDDSVFVHSTGNEWIPSEFVPNLNGSAPAAPASFSNLAGHDLRAFQNWDQYLGVFAANMASSDLAQAFVGAYNYESDLGIARIFSPQRTPGVKLFAWGPHACCRDHYTDDGSEYFELWGGIARTFFPDDDLILQPGEARAWTEYFLPLPATHGVNAALPDFSMSLYAQDNTVRLDAYAAAARDAILVLKQNGNEIKRRQIPFQAAQHWHEQIDVSDAALQFQLQDRDGNVLLEIGN